VEYIAFLPGNSNFRALEQNREFSVTAVKMWKGYLWEPGSLEREKPLLLLKRKERESDS